MGIGEPGPSHGKAPCRSDFSSTLGCKVANSPSDANPSGVIQYGKEGFSSRACFTDFKTVALNVLAKGGFGFSWDFVARGRRRCADDSNFATQYCDRLTLLMSGPDSTWIMATTPKFLYDHGPDYPWLLPENLRNHVVAARELKKQLEHLVAEKKAGLAAGEDENRNFLNELIANSEDVLQQSRLDDKAEKAEALRIPGFNEKEIFSNLINFGMAGYETTANTMAYCFHILSVHPEWQDWIQQELDHVLPDLSPDLGTPDYESTFPRLKRCMALMVCNPQITQYRIPPPLSLQAHSGTEKKPSNIPRQLCPDKLLTRLYLVRGRTAVSATR